MKKKLYTAPESIVVEFEASSIMTGSITVDSDGNVVVTNPGDNSGKPYQPESASRRGNDWSDYFGY